MGAVATAGIYTQHSLASTEQGLTDMTSLDELIDFHENAMKDMGVQKEHLQAQLEKGETKKLKSMFEDHVAAYKVFRDTVSYLKAFKNRNPLNV